MKKLRILTKSNVPLEGDIPECPEHAKCLLVFVVLLVDVNLNLELVLFVVCLPKWGPIFIAALIL